MKKSQFPPSEALYPAPVTLVSCIDKSKRNANIITIAWCGVVCSKPPLLSISIRPSRHSHRLISETGDFVINIPTVDLLEKVDACGVYSGKDSDKFELCGLTRSAAEKVSSPLINECPVNIECIVKQILKLGAHDMFIGQVVAVHADKSVLDKNGNIDYERAKPFVYNQGEYWSLGKKIGHYGCSKK